ncbi:MAG: YkvA family protein, partial [Actinomycetota bacterium]|nr:YkvA family protein [Actinomycetota bacterium]
LWLLLGYLLLPIDLIPDLIPVIGYADDAIVVALALRSVTRRAGPEALARQWPGSPQGLDAVRRLAGLDGRARVDHRNCGGLSRENGR